MTLRRSPILISLVVLVSAASASCGGDTEASDRTHPTATTTTAAATASRPGGTFTIEMQRGPNHMGAPTCIDAACVYAFTNSPIQVSGDFVGVASEAGSGAPLLGGGFGGTGYVVFTGSVPACGGSGSLAWTDRVTQSADGAFAGTWEIVKGSGTGALAHVSGSGSGATKHSGVAADGSGHASASGTVDCG